MKEIHHIMKFSMRIYQPLRSVGKYDLVSIFKRSLTGLNSEFSFF